MAVSRKEDEYLDIVGRECLLVHIVENDEIGEILLNSVGASCIDYLVGVKTDAPDLVGKTFVREIGKEVDLQEVEFGVKILKPCLYVGL